MCPKKKETPSTFFSYVPAFKISSNLTLGMRYPLKSTSVMVLCGTPKGAMIKYLCTCANDRIKILDRSLLASTSHDFTNLSIQRCVVPLLKRLLPLVKMKNPRTLVPAFCRFACPILLEVALSIDDSTTKIIW